MVEETFGVLKIDPQREKIYGSELFFGLHKIELLDNNFILDFENQARETEYINLEKSTQFEQFKDSYHFKSQKMRSDELIHMRYIMMTNQGGIHERVVTQILDEIGIVGGLLDVALKLGFVVFMITIRPFRELNLGRHFSMLKNMILHS